MAERGDIETIREDIKRWGLEKNEQNFDFHCWLENVLGWLHAQHGRHPFEKRLVTCFHCSKQLDIFHAYRCYDCNQWMHKDCLKSHFSFEKRNTEQVAEISAKGQELPEGLVNDVPHTA